MRLEDGPYRAYSALDIKSQNNPKFMKMQADRLATSLTKRKPRSWWVGK